MGEEHGMLALIGLCWNLNAWRLRLMLNGRAGQLGQRGALGIERVRRRFGPDAGRAIGQRGFVREQRNTGGALGQRRVVGIFESGHIFASGERALVALNRHFAGKDMIFVRFAPTDLRRLHGIRIDAHIGRGPLADRLARAAAGQQHDERRRERGTPEPPHRGRAGTIHVVDMHDAMIARRSNQGLCKRHAVRDGNGRMTP